MNSIARCITASAAALSALLLAVVASAHPTPLRAQSATQTVSQVSAADVPAASRALRPGDGLRVRIFREPELSGEFLVDERGIVVLPKLGEWNMSGVSADSVRPRLLTAYKKYLTTDAIEITPFRRVAVTGAVLKPGLYPIDPSMSVGDAIILAGGVAPHGKRNAIELRLASAESGVMIAGERRLWDSGAGGIRQLYVPEQSWIRRNMLTTVSLTLSLVTAAAVLFRANR